MKKVILTYRLTDITDGLIITSNCEGIIEHRAKWMLREGKTIKIEPVQEPIYVDDEDGDELIKTEYIDK